MIKKYLLTLLSVLFVMPAMANGGLNQQKIAAVKKIYQNLDSDSKQYMSPALKTLLTKYTNTEFDEICLEYDPIVQGQDFDQRQIQKTINYQLLKNGRVRVSFNNLGTKAQVDYQLVCQNNRCLIDDVVDESGSFKRNIQQCLAKNQ